MLTIYVDFPLVHLDIQQGVLFEVVLTFIPSHYILNKLLDVKWPLFNIIGIF